jgi:hypothetical protein
VSDDDVHIKVIDRKSLPAAARHLWEMSSEPGYRRRVRDMLMEARHIYPVDASITIALIVH